MLYTNDAIGRRTAREDSGSAFALTQANAFAYNIRSEVTKAMMSNGQSEYVFDPIGNRIEATLPEEQVPLVYAANERNQYTSITGRTIPVQDAYDDDGNMLDDGAGMVMEWDAENRLTKTVKGGQTVTYTYDYMSRRVAKTIGTTTHEYLYDGWNLIRETIINQQSKIENHYVWGLDLSQSMQGAGGVGGLLAAVHGANVYYPCFDANGNITQYVNSSSGTEVARYDYDAFGREFHSSGTMVDDFVFRFSTKYTDNETGLVYYGYRYYNPDLGRWINRDPIEEEGGLNLYGFVGNGGINSWDMIGLAELEDIQKLLTAILAAKGPCCGCPKITDYLQCMEDGVVGDNEDLIEALDLISSRIGNLGSRTKDLKTATDALSYLIDVFGVSIYDPSKGYLESQILGTAGRILGPVSKVAKLGASISRGDALDLFFVVGAEFGPKGINSLFGYYSSAYRTAITMIDDLVYKGNHAQKIDSGKAFCIDGDYSFARISMRTGVGDPWSCHKKLR